MAKVNDILTLIETDHRNVEQLFTEFENTQGSRQPLEIFNQIYKELTLHARAEELVFYPAMQEYDETRRHIEEAEKEHNSAKILLEEMKSFNPTDSEFQTKMKYLKETVLHHVKEEESEIFDAVRKCMKDQALQELGQEFQDAKARLKPDVEVALVS